MPTMLVHKVIAGILTLTSVATIASVAEIVATAVPLMACNTGGSCTYKSLCEADPPLTQDDITRCNNALGTPSAADSIRTTSAALRRTRCARKRE